MHTFQYDLSAYASVRSLRWAQYIQAFIACVSSIASIEDTCEGVECEVRRHVRVGSRWFCCGSHITCLGKCGLRVALLLPEVPSLALSHSPIVRVILSLYTITLYLSLSLYLFLDTMASSSAANSGSARDEQMLNVGRQCSHPTCHLVDFLPFKCQHCADSFCAEHFKPGSHTCAKYDEAKYNRVAPDCEYHPRCSLVHVQPPFCSGPLCNEPVPIPPGEDPNVRMERHLAMDCSVMTGRSKKANATPKCARPKCGKLLFAQIQCDVSSLFCSSVLTHRSFDLVSCLQKCYRKFCPEHRFPSSHNCFSISSASAPASTAFKPSSQAHVTNASGLAAIQRAAASVKSSASPPSKPSAVAPPTTGAASSSGVVASGSKTNTSFPKPFSKSKTDR